METQDEKDEFEKAFDDVCLSHALLSTIEKGRDKIEVGTVRTWAGKDVVRHDEGWTYLDQTGSDKHKFWKDGEKNYSTPDKKQLKHASDTLGNHYSTLTPEERYKPGMRVSFPAEKKGERMIGKVVAHAQTVQNHGFAFVRGEDGKTRKLHISVLKPDYSSRNIDKNTIKDSAGNTAIAKTKSGKPVSVNDDDLGAMDNSELREAHGHLIEHKGHLADVNSSTDEVKEKINHVRGKIARGPVDTKGDIQVHHLGPNHKGEDEYLIIHGNNGTVKTIVSIKKNKTGSEVLVPKDNTLTYQELNEAKKAILPHAEKVSGEDKIEYAGEKGKSN